VERRAHGTDRGEDSHLTKKQKLITRAYADHAADMTAASAS